MKKITLILGGIRSGKSYFAEQKAEYYPGKPVYIATAVAFDKEMEARIKLHRKRRGDRYDVIEVPYDITGPLRKLKDRTVLVDCMTLNLSNRLMATEEYMDLDELIRTDESYLADINKIIQKNRLNVIFVSNEVGFSPVEPNKLGRYFQELQGRWNRILAQYADEVYLVNAGIPSLLKKKSVSPFRISAPSYVLPTGYIENVTYLIDKVDDIQLLFFDSMKDDPLFNGDTLRTLRYLAEGAPVTFSAHMPVNPKVFDNLSHCIQTACILMEKIAPLDIVSYTFHYDLPPGAVWESLSRKEILKIDKTYISFINAVKERFPGANISLENTQSPVSSLDRVVKETRISYCIDIGHLIAQQRDLLQVPPRLRKTSVIHLHGWKEIAGKRKDHLEIIRDSNVLKLLEQFRGILTVENYHKMIFERSLDILREYF